jgi:phosphoglycerate dehydrogenase-like enzyme
MRGRTVTPSRPLDELGQAVDVSRMHSSQRLDLHVHGMAASQACRPIRIVCAVSRQERRLFLSRAVAPLDALPVALTWAGDNGTLAACLRENDADVVLTGWSTGSALRSALDAPASRVRYVCHLAGSVRHLVSRAFIERGGLVTNWAAIPAGAVAEQAVLLALAALRNLGAWPAAEPYLADTIRRIETLGTRSIFGRRVGLHGFGRVGQALVALLRPFGVAISAYSDGVPESLMREAGVAPCDSLVALFRGSEVLFECEGLTSATTAIVSSTLLAQLPDGAVFVNVARGQIVDETALLREQARGRLRVALDVVATKPVEKTRERFRMAGAVLSPHIAGPTLDQYGRCGDFAVENIVRFVRREPLQAVVTLEEYDRST